jgi:hypothetical protein
MQLKAAETGLVPAKMQLKTAATAQLEHLQKQLEAAEAPQVFAEAPQVSAEGPPVSTEALQDHWHVTTGGGE